MCAFGIWESGRGGRFTKEKEKRVYPTKTEAVERAKEKPDGDGRYVRQETIGVDPAFYYLDRKSSLLPAVKEYVEANMACFADKLHGWEGIVYRDLTIWGDEETAVLTKEEEQQMEEALGKRFLSLEIVRADYDNDGEEELFFREKDEAVRLLFWENGLKAEPVVLYGKEPAVQMWFVEFAGKTVTFSITMPYGEAYPLLSAYCIEEGQAALLLTCQLVYGDTAETGGSTSMRESSTYQDIYGFCPKVPLAERKQVLPWEAFMEEAEVFCGEVRVTPVWEEQPFSESFLSLIRQCCKETLAGRNGSAWQYMEPYVVDMEKDREAFLELLPGGEFFSEAYHWAYRFTAPDGTEQFLAERDCMGTIGVCTLEWFIVEGNTLSYMDSLTDYYRGDARWMVLFEGRLYCIIACYDFETKSLCGMHILPFSETGEWEHYYLSLTPDTKQYRLVCLYGGQSALSDYVEAVYQSVLADSVEQKVFTGNGENGVMTDELYRSIKNKDIWVYRSPASSRVIDANNDGEWEVIRTNYDNPSSYHQWLFMEYAIYGFRDGAFVEYDCGDIWDDYADYRGDNSPFRISSVPMQIWFEEIDGVTFLFRLDLLSPTSHYLLRAYVVRDGTVEDAGVWLLSAVMTENIEEAVYEDYLQG